MNVLLAFTSINTSDRCPHDIAGTMIAAASASFRQRFIDRFVASGHDGSRFNKSATSNPVTTTPPTAVQNHHLV